VNASRPEKTTVVRLRQARTSPFLRDTGSHKGLAIQAPAELHRGQAGETTGFASASTTNNKPPLRGNAQTLA